MYLKKLLTVFIGLFIPLLLIACSPSKATPAQNSNQNETARPNILFVIVDDLGRQDVGVYGSTLYETPNIDALAAEGMRFENAYAAHPRCVPSRTAIMSGQYPARLGIPGFNDKKISKHVLPLSAVTFAEQLKETGYSTGYIGKWHLGKNGGSPAEQGFDTSILAGSAGAPPSYFYPFHKMRNGQSPRADKSKKPKKFPFVEGIQDEHLTDRMATEAIGFIEENKDKPFMLVFANYAVHTPIQGKPELVSKYDAKLKDMGVADAGPKWANDVVNDGTGQAKAVQNNPVYAAMVESVDQNLGRIQDKLEALGIADNTIIILTSDHGGLSSRGLKNNRELATSNFPYRHGKGWLYEGGTRVPMIVKWPGHIAKGSVTNHQVTGTDHYPTILQLAGLPLTPEIHKDGESYFNTLNGQNTQRAPMFWHSPLGRPSQTGDTRATSMVEGDWKIIKWYVGGTAELYNISNDPGEKNDLSQSKPAKTKEMLGKLEAWKLSVNAQLPEGAESKLGSDVKPMAGKQYFTKEQRRAIRKACNKDKICIKKTKRKIKKGMGFEEALGVTGAPEGQKMTKEERKAERRRLRKACNKDEACLEELRQGWKNKKVKKKSENVSPIVPVIPAASTGQGKRAQVNGNGKNILFIAMDDLRPQIGVYGHPQMRTPNLDKLAHDGVQFTRAYSNVPVCGASRASLMTGLRPTNTRFKDFKTYASKDAPNVITLPQHFKNNGYYTASVGKVYHHLSDGPNDWSEPAWHPFQNASDKATSRRDYQSPANIEHFKTHKRAGPAYESADVPDEAYFDGKIRVHAIEKLREFKNKDEPFFLAVGFLKPHLPFNAPKKYWDMYDRNKIDLADNPLMAIGAPDDAGHRWGELRKYEGMPKYPALMPDDDARTLIHGYYASVSYADAQVGMVLSELERLGLAENTIVILWGDHGWSLGEHGLWAKHSEFNVANQVPFIILDPSKKGGKVSNGLVELLDIYPTLTELAGLNTPSHVQGVSLVSMLDDPNKIVNEAVFMKWHEADMIRTDRYYLTEWLNKDGSIKSRMLYDHSKDPSETVNLASDPKYKEIVQKLHKQLSAHLAAKK